MKNNSSSPDMTPIVDRFKTRINHFGDQPAAVLWRDSQMQVDRFDSLLQIIQGENNTAGLRIADFGCGYGALFEYIKDMPVMRDGHYVGYDITAEMIDACNKRIDDPRARFIHAAQVQEETDYLFISGTYSLKCGADREEWEKFVESSVKNLWSKTKKGLAVNFLRDTHPIQDPELYYVNLEQCRSFFNREISKTVVLNEGPVANEFTVLATRA